MIKKLRQELFAQMEKQERIMNLDVVQNSLERGATQRIVENSKELRRVLSEVIHYYTD